MPLLLWNPLNFIDGEGKWLAWEITILLCAMTVSSLLRLFLPSRMELISLVWYTAILHSFNCVTDSSLSQSFPLIWYALHGLGGILFVKKRACLSAEE